MREGWSAEDNDAADEFIAHAPAIRAERAAAAREGREPNLIALLNSWGGVTIAYRRRLIDAPSYTLNHEEVSKALEEGIRFAECLSPEAVEVDAYGHAAALHLKKHAFDPATKDVGDRRAGALAGAIDSGRGGNAAQYRARRARIRTMCSLDGKWFQAVDEEGDAVKPETVAKPKTSRVLMSLRPDGRGISFFGDLHPSFAGNVVKAMASAKQGHPVVTRMLSQRGLRSGPRRAALLETLNDELRAVRAGSGSPDAQHRGSGGASSAWPRARFKPGQFYRLQNFESLAPARERRQKRTSRRRLSGDGRPRADRRFGGSRTRVCSRPSCLKWAARPICARCSKPGEPVILMGPTGTPTETPAQETVLLVGGGLGNAVLFSIGQQLRAQGSRTIYFAGYKKIDRPL